MTRPADDRDPLAALLAATATGDEAAFARLYALASPQLFALLSRMLKRRDWAEEALQDCFLRIWQKADSYEPARGAPMAWLLTVARYRALDLIRVKRPEVPTAGAPADLFEDTGAADDPLRSAAERQTLNLLERCVEGLQAAQRISMLLAYYEGYTYADLTKRLKAPPDAARNWVRSGLLKLQQCLGA